MSQVYGDIYNFSFWLFWLFCACLLATQANKSQQVLQIFWICGLWKQVVFNSWKNNFLSMIRHVWSQTAVSEKIVVIKWLVNIEFLLPSSSTTIASRSKHDFGVWAIASHGRVPISPCCWNHTFIIVNSEHICNRIIPLRNFKSTFQKNKAVTFISRGGFLWVQKNV